MVGGLLWEAIFPGNDGIAWIGSIIVAVLLLILYGQFFGRGPRGARPCSAPTSFARTNRPSLPEHGPCDLTTFAPMDKALP